MGSFQRACESLCNSSYTGRFLVVKSGICLPQIQLFEKLKKIMNSPFFGLA